MRELSSKAHVELFVAFMGAGSLLEEQHIDVRRAIDPFYLPCGAFHVFSQFLSRRRTRNAWFDRMFYVTPYQSTRCSISCGMVRRQIGTGCLYIENALHMVLPRLQYRELEPTQVFLMQRLIWLWQRSPSRE